MNNRITFSSSITEELLHVTKKSYHLTALCTVHHHLFVYISEMEFSDFISFKTLNQSTKPEKGLKGRFLANRIVKNASNQWLALIVAKLP
jgi:hypothetical protein